MILKPARHIDKVCLMTFAKSRPSASAKNPSWGIWLALAVFFIVLFATTVLRRTNCTSTVLNTSVTEPFLEVACYLFNDKDAATLDQGRLEWLRDRSKCLPAVQDWSTDLLGKPRQALQEVSFAIPKVIHQVWVGDKPEPRMLLDTWRVDYLAKCPGWTHVLWTSANIRNLSHLDMPFLDAEQSPNGKSDILRAAILYEHGGVYIDADTLWVNGRCLDDVLMMASDTGFIAAMEPDKTWCASGVIGVVKRHPVTKLFMQSQHILGTGGRTGDPWQTIGPLAVSAAMSASDNFASSMHCRPNSGGQLVLPPQYFASEEAAATSLLMTVLHSKYFYPVSWVTHDFSKVSNLTYVEELVQKKYPDAMMYQFGFSTHSIAPLFRSQQV